jgi:Lrp/AsnC family transcriptional regulator for asnA, asnC and gidA
MFDKINCKILKNICRDANISNVKLAKTIGVNTATVAKRIDAMLKKDMIAVKAVPDLSRLGYNVGACIALNVDLTSIDELSAILMESPNIHLAVTTFGRYDIVMLGSFSDWEKLMTFMREGVTLWPGVKQTNIFLISEVKKIHRDLFHNISSTESPAILDDIDSTLIQELGKNGLTSYTEIAHKLGVNPATISRRVGSLLKKKIIKIVAVPDPSEFGYSASALIILGTDHAKTNEICAELNKYPQIQVSMTLTVGFDILACVQFPNPELLYQFIKNKIARISGITTIETLIITEYLKATYTWIDFDDLPC